MKSGWVTKNLWCKLYWGVEGGAGWCDVVLGFNLSGWLVHMEISKYQCTYENMKISTCKVNMKIST